MAAPVDMATTYTKTVSLLGAEIFALRDTIAILHALAHKLGGPASRDLMVRVEVLEKLTNQLMR